MSQSPESFDPTHPPEGLPDDMSVSMSEGAEIPAGNVIDYYGDQPDDNEQARRMVRDGAILAGGLGLAGITLAIIRRKKKE